MIPPPSSLPLPPSNPSPQHLAATTALQRSAQHAQQMQLQQQGQMNRMVAQQRGVVAGPREQIYPSHPNHPQHLAWQHQQSQLQRAGTTGVRQPPLRSATLPNQSQLPLQGQGIHRPMSIPPPTTTTTLLPPTTTSTPVQGVAVASATGQQQNSGLGAHLAAIGAGPITATPLPHPSAALTRLYALNEALSQALETGLSESFRTIVDEFFTGNGVVKYGLFEKGGGMKKVFEIPCSAFPRFNHINALCGVLSSLLLPTQIREFFLTCPDPSSSRPVHIGYLLKADSTTWSSKFSQGVKVDLEGSLSVHWVVTPGGGLKVEGMEFTSRGHEEFVERGRVVKERVEHLFDLIPTSPPPSPTTTKRSKKPLVGTRRRSQTNQKDEEEIKVEKEEEGLGTERKGVGSVWFERALMPGSPVGSFGITEMGMRCLEIAESVAQLQDLISYAQEARIGPIEALNRFASAHLSLPPTQPDAPIATTSQNAPTNTFYSSSVIAESPKREREEDFDGGSPGKMMRGGSGGAGRGRGRGRGTG